MFKGFILSESLKNPEVLNRLDHIYVKVEHHPEFLEEPKIWHDFKVRVADKDIKKVSNLLAKQMKQTWYAHFWDKKSVYVILPKKVFKIPLEKKWTSKEYLRLKRYAVRNGVEEQYLNFWIQKEDKI
ncbi:MAG: hypothetical protein HYW89_01510 [Candidatus Sungiibacteriota bacterium]|uniref:Uncharacterized protein n=1 Tax=Candidatus Sungiibacteriota bacterium TaxID=2750080 RepID=A0A7T5RK50_9BACT|nr:MAG: hypothetical protein HYW89_01510 [Candidatus Sungbacteria bacterium]